MSTKCERPSHKNALLRKATLPHLCCYLHSEHSADSNHTDPPLRSRRAKSKCHCAHQAGFPFLKTPSPQLFPVSSNTPAENAAIAIYMPIMTALKYRKPLPVCLQITKVGSAESSASPQKQNSCKKRKKLSLSFHRKINSSQNRYPDTDQ